jgi:Crinkler effector protein N-terminal domain
MNELKEAIPAKKPSFKNIDADLLQLWKVVDSTAVHWVQL